MSNTMRTVGGKYIDINAPTADDIDIRDIGHALSGICRFGAHSVTFYTVAEHSIHVAAEVQRRLKKNPPRTTNFSYNDTLKAALLHDAAEAYLGDVISPLKPLLGNYGRISQAFDDAIAAKFDFDPVAFDSAYIKEVDKEIVEWEMVFFRDSRLHPPADTEYVFEQFLVVAHGVGIDVPNPFA